MPFSGSGAEDAMSDNVEIIRSNKGGMKIIHRGYMYTVHKKRQGGGIRWRCTQRSLHCKGSISTGNGPPSVNMPHNHIPDPHSVALARCRQLEEFPDISSLLETEYEDIKDTVPLQQRMLLNSPPQVQIPSSSEPQLQSQPLSPTKLKVTRQNCKPQTFAPQPAEVPAEEVCLRWNSHHSNMQNVFPQLLEKERYVDVTVIAEEKTLKCHRMILSSCSSYFEQILDGITPLQHPVIILKGIPFWILKALIDFMYVGEINIDQNKLPELLDVAELLKVKGLAGKSNTNSSEPDKPEPPPSPPPKKQPKESPVKSPPSKPAAPACAKVEDTSLSDPLDLLEPKFHEEAESLPSKIKENRLPPKKPLVRKFRKRKSSEDDEACALPLFPMRRGTRSRPNVKIPKYYDYEDIVKPCTSDAQAYSPIMNIKSEPVDIDEVDVCNEQQAGLAIENNSAEKPEPGSSEALDPVSDNKELPPANNLSDKEDQIPLYKIKIKSLSSLSENTENKRDDGGEEKGDSQGLESMESDCTEASSSEKLGDNEEASTVENSTVDPVQSNDVCNQEESEDAKVDKREESDLSHEVGTCTKLKMET